MRMTHPILIALVGATIFFLIMLCGPVVEGDTIVVDPAGGGDYTTIQDAADSSQDGDTIDVHPGTYFENVRLYNEVTLRSSGGGVTVDGQGDRGIHLYRNNTIVSGISVLNASNGIYVFNNSFTIRNVTIDNCTVYDGNDPGITFYHVSDSTIIDCTSYNNSNDGIMFDQCSDSVIAVSSLYGNGRSGINLMGAGGNLITSCLVQDNGDIGLILLDSFNTTVRNATTSNNTKTGIDISATSYNNTLYHNSILDNPFNAIDNGSTIWDNGFPSGGNTWSDYDEISEGANDLNGDGFADDPYLVPGIGNTDRYPLVSNLDPVPPVANAGEDLTIEQFRQVTFDGSGSTDNVEIANYSWEFDDNGPVILEGEQVIYHFSTVGSYSVNLTVTDLYGNTHTDLMWVHVTKNSMDYEDPVAVAGPDQTVFYGESVSFIGSSSTDNVGIVSYDWAFIDGGTRILEGKSVEYSFTTPGIFQVRLLVLDAEGNFDTDFVNYTIQIMAGSGNVSGRVMDPDGDPMNDITVTLQGTGKSWSVISGPSGQYTFYSIPAGLYAIVGENDYRYGELTVTIEEGKTTSVDIIVERRSITREKEDDPPFMYYSLLTLVFIVFVLITQNMLKKDTQFRNEEKKISSAGAMEGVRDPNRTKEEEVEKVLSPANGGRGNTEQSLNRPGIKMPEDPFFSDPNDDFKPPVPPE